MTKRFREDPETFNGVMNSIAKSNGTPTTAILSSCKDMTNTEMGLADVTQTTTSYVGSVFPGRDKMVDSGYMKITDPNIDPATGVMLDAGGERVPVPGAGGEPQGIWRFFRTMWQEIELMISRAAKNVAEFFTRKTTGEDGEMIESVDYVRIAGVTMFFALIVFGTYKLIKWFRLRKEEQNKEAFNSTFKDYKRVIKENIVFFNNLNSKMLNENTDLSQNTTVKKAMELTPTLAQYALEAEEKKEETKSIFKKYGYWILGSLCAIIVIGLYAYYGRGEDIMTGGDPKISTSGVNLDASDPLYNPKLDQSGVALDAGGELSIKQLSGK